MENLMRVYMKIFLGLLFLFPFMQVFSAETEVSIHLFTSLLPDNPVVVEAGAQFGEDTYKMSLLWPNGVIHAFEPSPSSHQSLEKVSLKRQNIFTYQKVVSNRRDKMPFYLSGGASSLLEPEESFNRDYFHVDVNNPVFVDVITLDEWLEETGIPKVDFLWLDMEGNELNALKGMQNHLSSVSFIYTEVNIQKFWKGCVCYEELKNWLSDQGFEEIWHEIIPGWQGNALFVNTAFQQRLHGN